MGYIEILKIGITDLQTDAIVNAANEGLWAGGGVCGAVFKAAGYDRLQAACDRIGHCSAGSAVITDGFDLKAKYIIHAVGPQYRDGKHGEPKLLYSAYFSSLELALEKGCKSIGFPLISAGIFGYPRKEAWKKALQACRDFLMRHKEIQMKIVFAVLDDEILKLGREMLKETAPEFKKADRWDRPRKDMPAARDIFLLQKDISEEKMARLEKGHIPRSSEDKWFYYMEGSRLFIHRSWTGFCIYTVELSPDGCHEVTVNRDPQQYSCQEIGEDEKNLSALLDAFTDKDYDPYRQWLSETVGNLKRQ